MIRSLFFSSVLKELRKGRLAGLQMQEHVYRLFMDRNLNCKGCYDVLNDRTKKGRHSREDGCAKLISDQIRSQGCVSAKLAWPQSFVYKTSARLR